MGPEIGSPVLCNSGPFYKLLSCLGVGPDAHTVLKVMSVSSEKETGSTLDRVRRLSCLSARDFGELPGLFSVFSSRKSLPYREVKRLQVEKFMRVRESCKLSGAIWVQTCSHALSGLLIWSRQNDRSCLLSSLCAGHLVPHMYYLPAMDWIVFPQFHRLTPYPQFGDRVLGK